MTSKTQLAIVEQSEKSLTPEPISSRNVYDEADRLYQGELARMTGGLTPAGLTEMCVSWLAHLAMCPGRMAELATFPLHHLTDALATAMSNNDPTAMSDHRFQSDNWKQWPWNSYAQGFRQLEAFWDRATKNIPGLSPQHERAMSFTVHQLLDAISPANFISSNPDIVAATVQSGGGNLVQGVLNAYEDIKRKIHGKAPPGTEDFIPGKTLAMTEGKVIYRNGLIELIQYTPQTEQVHKEPILIIPAWIMKYYILDLSPHNSMVKWLVGEGHTVFMISWKNPTAEDRDKGMDEYMRDGALAAVNAVSSIVPDEKIHLVGYCLGGTLAMITAALMAEEGDTRLKSLSLFAAQGDFTEAGGIMVFVTDSEVNYLKNMMWSKGYLDGKQMQSAFQLLSAHDTIWSPMVQEYLMGERTGLFDLMAWDADATRLPYKMHSEYLERLFLGNAFAEGHFTVLGKPVAPENINIPVFMVGTEKDQVAPWKSVYKVHFMVSGDVTFVLTSGGHNAGIVSEPGHPHRYYHVEQKKSGNPYKSPEDWLQHAPRIEGSWWQAWNKWLGKHDGKQVAAHKKLGNATYKPLCDAPGTFVHQQ